LFRSIFEAYAKGPSSSKQARTMILIACGVVAFTVLTTGVLYGYYLLANAEGELGLWLDDPSIPAMLVALSVFGYFTYRAKVWAAVILLINQAFDVLVLVMDSSGGVGFITVFKVIIYIGAVQATWYLRNSTKNPEEDA